MSQLNCKTPVGVQRIRELIETVTGGAWVDQSVERPTLDFGSGRDPRGHGIEPCVGLRAECGACLGFSLSFPLLPFPICAISLSLSDKILKIKKKKKENITEYVYVQVNYRHHETCSLNISTYIHLKISTFSYIA